MSPNQMKMLKELMEISFCLLDINLFLDTHPNDEKALRLHNTFALQYQELEKQYSIEYGPIKSTSLSKYPWEYINEPWPWEIDYPKC